MTNEEQIRQIGAFLDRVIVRELGKVQESGLSYMQFVLMGQAIEVLGSLLDHKPMKAKGQSALRFSRAVNSLFGGRYRLLNDRYFLYDKLRNQMTHTFIPGRDLLLLGEQPEDEGLRHLACKDGRLVLVGTVFYRDICQACARLMNLLKAGKVKPKNIAFEYDRP